MKNWFDTGWANCGFFMPFYRLLKGISLFDAYLRDGGGFSRTHKMHRWESTYCILDCQWKALLQALIWVWQLAMHWDQYFWMIYSCYLNPAKLSLMYPDHCLKKCVDKGLLLHSCWYCKSINLVWNQVAKIMKQISGWSDMKATIGVD